MATAVEIIQMEETLSACRVGYVLPHWIRTSFLNPNWHTQFLLDSTFNGKIEPLGILGRHINNGVVMRYLFGTYYESDSTRSISSIVQFDDFGEMMNSSSFPESWKVWIQNLGKIQILDERIDRKEMEDKCVISDYSPTPLVNCMTVVRYLVLRVKELEKTVEELSLRPPAEHGGSLFRDAQKSFTSLASMANE